VGVANVTFESDYFSGQEDEDEAHAWNAIAFDNLRGGFADGISCTFFSFSCVSVLRGAMHVTTSNAASHRPVSTIQNGRRYSFYIEGQASLFTGCTCDLGRHSFVTSSRVAGPNAFVDCHATNTLSDVGPHNRFATGLLFDGVTGGAMSVENRGKSGSGHGWTGVGVVYWNCEASSTAQGTVMGPARLRVDAPPGYLSWSVGNTGLPMSNTVVSPAMFATAAGGAIWESHGRHVEPRSLYAAQFAAAVPSPPSPPPSSPPPPPPPPGGSFAEGLTVNLVGKAAISAR